MLVSAKVGADFSAGCALSVIRPAFLLTHPHPAVRESLRASPVSI